MIKRALCLLLVLVLLAVSGCTQATTPPPGKAAEPAADKAEVVTVKVASIVGFPIDPMLDSLIAAFHDKYPAIRVEKVPVGLEEDVEKRFRALADAGQVDVLPLKEWGLNDETDLYQPLDPFVRTSGFDLKPYGDPFNRIRTQEQLYYLPFAMTPVVMLANQEHLKAAGASLPQGQWTWEQFRELAAKLAVARRGGGDSAWGVADMTHEFARMYMEGLAPGSVDRADEEVARKTMRFFADMVHTDRSLQPSAIMPDGRMRYGDLNSFAEGKASMTMFVYGQGLATWGFPTVGVPMPSHPGKKPVSQAIPWLLGITKRSQRPDAAWTFVQFACGPEGAGVLARSGTLPMYNSAAVKQAWLEQVPAPPAFTASFFETDWLIDMTRLETLQDNQALFHRIALQEAAVVATVPGGTVDDAMSTYRKKVQEARPR